MKLVVFAHTPPPVHGQSVMVAMLVEGLRGGPPLEILHVNPQLSRNIADIGTWRPGKLLPLLRACFAAWKLRRRHGPCAFYYVPAPGKRSALYRDFIVLLLCRPCFGPLVLHWHASGLGEWLATRVTAPERWLAHRLLGRAALALVLAPELQADAARFAPRRIAVVPNGVADPVRPGVAPRAARPAGAPCEVLFLGMCGRTKGTLDAVEGVALADARGPGGFRLTVAGRFETAAEERAFRARVAQLRPGLVHYAGFADEARKRALFAAADVFCFPTAYPHEGQPLVIAEALAHDVPIVATRWRAIPGMLPAEHVWFVAPHQPGQVADALLAARSAPRPAGALRRHYLAHFTPERHLARLEAALLSVAPETRA
jgi:glycosyltransferase involved in cell wall biosynthesis